VEIAVEADEPLSMVSVCAFCDDPTGPEDGFFKREKNLSPISHCWEGALEFSEAKHHIASILVSVGFGSGGEDSVSLQDAPADWTQCETGQEKVDRQIAMLRRISLEQIRWFRDNMMPLYTWRPDDRRIGAVMEEANRLIAERGESEQKRS
jgi:hypothetical protein